MNSFQVILTIITMTVGGQVHETRHLQTDMTTCFQHAQLVLERLVSTPEVMTVGVGCVVDKGEPA